MTEPQVGQLPNLAEAAHDLYEALQSVLPILEKDCYCFGWEEDEYDPLLIARAALAKARGE